MKPSSLTCCTEFHTLLLAGDDPGPCTFLEKVEPCERAEFAYDLLQVELRVRIVDRREVVDFEAMIRRLPELTDESRLAGLNDKQELERKVFLPQSGSPEERAEHDRPPGLNLPEYNNWIRKGSGAMAEVWVASQVDLPAIRKVFKIPHPHILAARRRPAILDEARKATKVLHPNVVRVEHVDRVRPYIRMEYVEGPTLEDWAREGSPRALAQVAEMVARIARGVQAIHDAGLYHLDLKPANVMVATGPPERLVVIDFGLAKEDVGGEGRLGGCASRGTAAYMAPEQVPEEVSGHASNVDARTDVHALGAILYWLVEGRCPFIGANRIEVCQRILHEQPVFTPRRWRGTVPGLRAIVVRAMTKDPAGRYPSAGKMADDLELSAAGMLPGTLEAGVARRVANGMRRHWRGVAVALLGVGIVAAAGVLGPRAYQERQCQTLRDAVDRKWEQASLSEADEQEIETALIALDRLDPASSNARRETYVVKLIDQAAGRPPNWSKLPRIEGQLDLLLQHDPARAERVRSSGAWGRFLEAALPHLHSGSYYAYLRPDRARIGSLERVVALDQRLHPEGASREAELELFRACFARGDLDRARALAVRLLDRPGLSPAWRMTILRELTWLAIWSS